MRTAWVLVLLAVSGAYALSPELIPIMDGKSARHESSIAEGQALEPKNAIAEGQALEPKNPIAEGQALEPKSPIAEGQAQEPKRALLTIQERPPAVAVIEVSVNSTLVDPYRIVRETAGGDVVGQVTSDPVTSANYTNATELCIFLNASIPVDNETYSVEAIARVDDTNSSLVLVYDAYPVVVVNASYYCTNVTNGTFYTALIEASTTGTTTGTASDSSADSSSTTLSTGVIAGIVIAAAFGAVVLAIVLVLAIRKRPPRNIYIDQRTPAGNAPLVTRPGDRFYPVEANAVLARGRPDPYAQRLRFNSQRARRLGAID